MKTFEYEVKDPMGIHARPAGILVKTAATFPCNITIESNGKTADAKKIIAVMGLGVKQGQVIKANVDGESEDDACTQLKAFFEENF